MHEVTARIQKVGQVKILAHLVQVRVASRMVRHRPQKRLVFHSLLQEPMGAGRPVEEMPGPTSPDVRRVDRIGHELRRIRVPQGIVKGGGRQPATHLGLLEAQRASPGGEEIAHPADVLEAGLGGEGPVGKPPVGGSI